MKLVVDEPESAALAAHLRPLAQQLATSRLAVVEVARAVHIANASIEAQARAREVLDGLVLVDVGGALLQAAAALASERLRTLDAIHLATIELVDPDEVLVYDVRLRNAARDAGYATISPGAE